MTARLTISLACLLIANATGVEPRDHWSFQPLAQVQSPAPKDLAWPRNDLDRFILDRLEKESLHPSPEAERTAWLRRVYFDLIGLPAGSSLAT